MTATLGQAALLLVTVSALGALLPLHRRWSERGLHVFVAIATGVFLGTIFLHLLPELAAATARDARSTDGESAGHAVSLRPWWAALIGLVLLFVLEKVWLGRRRGAGAHGDQHDVVCFATFIGLSVHSLVTGLGFSAVVSEPALLWPLVTAVAVHKAGEGFSLATVMRLAHLPTSRSLTLLAVFCIATPLGLLMGAQLAMGEQAARITPLLTGLACGTFLYVAVADLLPEVFHGARDGAPRIIGLLVGIGVAAVGFAGIH
jgi:zinc transporter ZupT